MFVHEVTPTGYAVRVRVALVLLMAIASTGCARRAVVRRPEPCTCAPKRAAAGAPIATSTTPAPARTPPRDLTEDEAIDRALDVQALASEIAMFPPPECKTLEPAIAAILHELEPEHLAAIRDARAGMLVDDATPATERAAIARAAYEQATVEFETQLTKRLRDAVFDACIAPPAIATVYDTAMLKALVGSTQPVPLSGSAPAYKLTPSFRVRFREAAIRHAASSIEPVVAACTSRALDTRRGRWIALFNGKL